MTVSSPGQPFFFEDCVVGEEHLAGTYKLSAASMIEFASEWDPQPFHIDEVAARDSIFGGLTACSAHIFAIFCITSQRWQSGVVQQAVAGLGFDDMRMHQPVFAGDVLRCKTVIAAARLSASNPDSGIVSYDTRLENQQGVVVFSIRASSMLARDPARMASKP